jgi:hypothetical protein
MWHDRHPGPGEIYPADVNVPAPGCWRMTLHWNGHADSIDLAYRAGKAAVAVARLSATLTAGGRGLSARSNRVHDATMSMGTATGAEDRRADRPAHHLGHGWMSRRCIDCGCPKPLVTAYCDRCAEQHGLPAAS